jgi:hypothetical protein
MTTCERIFTTPIPLMYTRHTARFLLLWLLAMPMCLYHEYALHQKWMVPIISFLQAIFLFGIEELGVQIEEPFSILPLANICSDIHRSGEELLYEAGIPWFGCSDEHQVVVEEENLQSQIHPTLPPMVTAAAARSVGSAKAASIGSNLPEYLYASQGYFNTTSMPGSMDMNTNSLIAGSSASSTNDNSPGGPSASSGGSADAIFRIPID